jgi:hypothetical protein
VADNNKDWDEFVQMVTFAYNTSKHTTTSVTPFQYIYGKLPVLPIDYSILPQALLGFRKLGSKQHIDYIERLKDRLKAFHELGYFKSLQAARRVETNLRPGEDFPQYKVGDKVWLFCPNRSEYKKTTKKLTRYWKGP